MRAEAQGNDIAYKFLIDGENLERSITYHELYYAAARVARRLAAGHSRGERALLLFAPGLDYITAFFGCLLAGIVAVPAYPPQDTRGGSRLDAIVADAGANIALTTQDLLPLLQSAIQARPVWIATDVVDDLGPDSDLGQSSAGDLAFLQYTSGSTRSPRGVMLTHTNLMANLSAIHETFAGAARDVMVSWLPPYHDMGLIGAILEPMYGGFAAVLMSPFHFLQKPLRWLTAISDHHGTISPSPNFGFELCLRKVDDRQRADLDLSSWRAAVNGAEPVRAETIDAFTARFADAGFTHTAFRPAYGLAEATLLVSADPVGEPVRLVDVDGKLRVACGTARGDQSILVVDTATLRIAAPGQTGEIWVSGANVAAGYWNRPTESAALFTATLPGHEGRFLRTGDLGLLTEDGSLTIAGRLKDLIVLRGRNLYPHDAESAAEGSHPAVRPGCAAAFTVNVNGEERLVLVAEAADGADTDEVALCCRKAIWEQCDTEVHELVLIAPRTIPKTSSGKIQRRATREAYLSGELARTGGWYPAPPEAPPVTTSLSPLETLIAGIWSDLLDRPDVGIHEDFFASGAQSLLLSRLAARIEAELPVRITIADIFHSSTVAQLAALLESRPLTIGEEHVAELVSEHEPPRGTGEVT
jgi:acyl-CoA synthetase (AMP-forming)/AMP-acid ligase II